MTTTRFFYRCTGCLDVVTLDTQLDMAYGRTIATCGTCHEPMEYLGRVQRDRLVIDAERCACDERCTCARGPICNCACAGKNHGKGLAATIHYTIDRGPVPVLRTPSTARTRKALAAFEQYRTLRTTVRAEIDGYLDRRAAGEFLPRPAFDRLRRLQDAYRKAHAARTHAGRIKTLAAVVSAAVTEETDAPWQLV